MGALAAVVDTYAAADPTELDDSSLGEQILEIDTAMRRLSAARADRLRVFDARDASVADGLGTASAWLAAKTGNTGLGAARAEVALGRDLVKVPLFAVALSAGEITAAHLKIFATAAGKVSSELAADGEPTLLEHARQFEPRVFARLVRYWLAQVSTPDFERDEERKVAGRSFSLAETLDDIWHGQLTLDPEGGARLHAILQARAQKAGPDDERTRDQRWADALVSLADEILGFGDLPTTAGHRPEIVVHATEDNLTGDGDDVAPATLDDGTPLTQGTFDRIACDARWRRLLLDALDVPLSYGRSRRDWPPSLRKFIALRDGGCRWGDCPMPARACEVHHCQYWENGGETCAGNGLLLCRWHHHCIHNRGHSIKLLPDGTAETTLPDGRVLVSRPRGPTPRLQRRAAAQP